MRGGLAVGPSALLHHHHPCRRTITTTPTPASPTITPLPPTGTTPSAVSMHPKLITPPPPAETDNHHPTPVLRHPVYTPAELAAITYTHKPVRGIREALAFSVVRALRFGFDLATNYSDKTGVMTERQWLNRIVFLETVAGIPGMVAGMARHVRSLRIITLLEEAENERMHLLTFLKLKNPGPLFRLAVLVTQGLFFNAYFLAYLLAPRACHTFVGYLEENAVHTYTVCLKDIEEGQIKHWGTMPAPEIARSYWRLGAGATVRDVVEAVRADEADHRDTNHLLSGLSQDQPNPLVKRS
ncbi:hypothetical protein HDU96_001713 [Phlyctochytrium bullatum]|nr:hypothetical protein HDU96_001713 [Phlyctochytrium bullatum]